MKARIETLDELRALAIVAVLISHFALAFGAQSTIAYWLNFPDLSVGVDLFFVISGYLIFNNLDDLTKAAPNVWRGVAAFYVRRLTRIAFPAWVMIAALATARLAWPASTTSDLTAAAGFVANIHWGQCGAGARCGDPLASSHFWSLSSEAQFYLLAPALLLGRRAAPYAAITALILCSALPHPHGSLLWTLRPDALLLGAALASEEKRKAEWLATAPALSQGLAVYWLLVASIVAQLGNASLSGPAWSLTALICAGIMLGRLNAAPIPGRAGISWRAIGKASFSIYLVHLPIIGWAAEIAAPRIGAAAAAIAAVAAISAVSALFEAAIVNPAARMARDSSRQILSNVGGGPEASTKNIEPCREPAVRMSRIVR
ncbi:MAG: acyltransferase family protein [Methylocystis sp.]